MIPLDRREIGNTGLVRLSEQTYESVQNSFENVIRSMELASVARDRYPDSARAELVNATKYWRDRHETFNAVISSGKILHISTLEKLIALVPPAPPELRFSLIRLSPSFMAQFSEFGPDRLDILGSVISNFERESPSVALNLLDHILDGAPSFYAALVLKGSLLLESNEQLSEAPDLFNRAGENPPRGEYHTFYKIAALELLAQSLIRVNRPGEAVSVYRRILGIIGRSSLHDYHLTRALSITRKTTEAVEAFDNVLLTEPTYYAYALMDDDVQFIHDQIIERLEQSTGEWAETIDKVIGMADSVLTIASEYELTQHPAIANGQRDLINLQESAHRGSYSVYRNLGLRLLPDWTRQYVNRIQETLQNSFTARRESIKQYNESLLNLNKESRRQWITSWGAILFVLGLSVIVLLRALQVSSALTFVVFMTWILGVFIYRLIVNHRITKSVNKRMKDPDILNSIKDDINRVGQFRSEMLIMMEKAEEEVVGQTLETKSVS